VPRGIFARCDDENCWQERQGRDFYSLSGCRDLISTHRNTLHAGRSRLMIGRLDPGFIGFEVPEPGAVAGPLPARFPERPSPIESGQLASLRTGPFLTLLSACTSSGLAQKL